MKFETYVPELVESPPTTVRNYKGIDATQTVWHHWISSTASFRVT